MISVVDDLMRGGPVERLFNSPDNRGALIWRYLGLAQFLYLLETKHLIFPRADRLGDSFEGAVPLEQLRVREEQIESALPLYPGLEDRRASVKSEMIEGEVKFRTALPSRTFVSCWHMSEHESDFWHHYAERETAICIRSTFQRLVEVTAPYASVGAVRYLDYEKETLPADAVIPYGPFFHKRRAYHHESEVRAVIWRVPKDGMYLGPTPKALGIPLDPHALIEAIYISPYSSEWFSELAKGLLARYKLDIPVLDSSLHGKPSY